MQDVAAVASVLTLGRSTMKGPFSCGTWCVGTGMSFCAMTCQPCPRRGSCKAPRHCQRAPMYPCAHVEGHAKPDVITNAPPSNVGLRVVLCSGRPLQKRMRRITVQPFQHAPHYCNALSACAALL